MHTCEDGLDLPDGVIGGVTLNVSADLGEAVLLLKDAELDVSENSF